MLSYETVGTGQRPPLWRTLLYGTFAALGGLLSSVFTPTTQSLSGEGASGLAAILAFAGMLFGIGLPVILGWRHRYPFAVALVPALLSLVLPIGNTLAFVGLAALIGRRRGPAVLATIGLTSLTSAWVVIRDASAQPRGASLAKTTFGPTGGDPHQPMDLSPEVIVGVIVVGLLLTVGAGLAVRWKRMASSATAAVEAERVETGRLGDEVARREERERIAREVHDAMGHRLSLLNLHAGALEVNANGDPEVRESASLVRRSAGEAMDDLRSLLSVLRQPLGDEPPSIPLTQLQQVVRDSFGAGQNLNSSIFIQDAERADPTLSRAVYRIVQEALTNARKHAPDQPVLLTVEGSPAAGVDIDVRNRMPSLPDGGGRGRGLLGIGERAELLGGQLSYGVTEQNEFSVHVSLPWREATQH